MLRGEIKNCTTLWPKAHLQVKMYKTPHVWTTFVCSDVEKLHAAVAKSTFASQNVQNTACLDHFWTFRCRKIARHCGEKHIRKSKCTKHRMFGAAEYKSFHLGLSVEGVGWGRGCRIQILSSRVVPGGCVGWGRGCRIQILSFRVVPGGCGLEEGLPNRSDVEKLHATVAKSTFGSENAKKLTIRDHFCLFRCRKIARRCGEKHI